jgi:hypothetical protein
VDRAIVGALVLAALSTLGDFVWANWSVRHLTLYGVLHGMAIFMAIGVILGVRRGARRAAAGAVLGIIAGALAAGSFYAMRSLLGYSAMFASWMLVWLALGVIGAMLAAPSNSSLAGLPLRRGLARGLAAALLSGAAFYAVSGMWMPFNPRGWMDYAEHFVRWTIAFLPAFAALLVGADPPPPRRTG